MAAGFFEMSHRMGRGCSVCPLRGKKVVKGRGNPRAEIVFVGEGPGAQEEEHGYPFFEQAPAGGRLTRELAALGLPRSKVWLANAIRCRATDPSGNNREPSDKETFACSIYFDELIDTLRPKVIVALGNVPTMSLVGQAGIGYIHGTVWNYRDKTFVVPTYHPSHLNREDDRDRTAGVKLAKEFRTDIKLAMELVNVPFPTFHTILCETEEEALKWLHLASFQDAISIDIEGYPDNILTLGISYGDDAFVIPLQHPESKLAKNERIAEAIRALFTNPGIEKIGQNMNGYDRPILEKHFGVRMETVNFDTMYGSYIDDERANIHGLKMIASRWINCGGYDWAVQEYLKDHSLTMKDMAKVPLKILAEYNGRDVIATIRIYREMMREFTDKYKRLTVLTTHVSQVTKEMEVVGIGFDMAYSMKLQRDLAQELTDIENRIRIVAGDRQMNIASSDQVGKLLFETLQLHRFLSEEDSQYIQLKTETGKWATGDPVIEALYRATKHPVLKDMQDHRDKSKDNSTYVQGIQKIVARDGRVHTPMILHGSETGRAANRLHNIKKQFVDENGIRRYVLLDQFVAREGWSFLRGDFSQIEMRVMAEMSGDPELMEIFQSGKDFHHETAVWLYGLKLGETETEEQRTIAKNTNFGMAYGLDAESLYDYLRTKIPELQLTKSAVADFHRKQYARLKVLRQWQLDTIAFAKKCGYVEGVFGRTRHLNMSFGKHAENQAINTPIQGSAHDLTMVGLIQLYEVPDRSYWIVLERHDDMVLEVPDEDLYPTANLMLHTMSHLDTDRWFGKTMKVPVCGDVKAGKTLGTLKALSGGK
jgi:DNA polymerase-1